MSEIKYIKPLSDFEKLLFAESYIKELKILAGKDHAYIEELQARITELEKPLALTPEEKIEIKKGELYENLRQQLRQERKEVHRLNKKLRDLTNEIIKLRNSMD